MRRVACQCFTFAVTAYKAYLRWGNLIACFNFPPGSILEGPDPDKMKPVVAEAMPSLIALLRDNSPAVRDTVAWTVGRVCELLPGAAINPIFLLPLVRSLLLGLEDVPRVAANVAWVSQG